MFELRRVVGLCALSVTMLAVCQSLTGFVSAQENASADGLWRNVPASSVRATAANAADAVDTFAPRNARLFDLDLAVLARLTGRAAAEAAVRANAAAARESAITIPMPDGSFHRFELIESPVMSAALQAKFPNIRSYRGHSLDDPLVSMRMDVSPRGVHAQVISPAGTVIVDPAGGGNRYRSYSKRQNRARSERFRCLVQGRGPALAAREAATVAAASGHQLRTYRLAVACTGEYTQRFGGTVVGAMSAINTTVNRVTGIYEREVAVRLELVDDNDQLIFTDAATDPFNNLNANILINQSQAVIDDEIGNANYDIGHTFSTGAGGLAGLGVVGRTGEKARGVTGRSNPVGDPFDVDYVAHEMGHQFGGDHTFNGRSGSCTGGNRNAATAVEPGSGSTIQAYAGICGPDDLQQNSDPYFHSVSLDQIISYSTVGAGNVVMPQPTGNTPPAVNAGSDRVIPKLTPFQLVATGTDADGDRLLYCWEQRDLGPAAAADAPDDGNIPLFRSLDPTPDGRRVFPQWSDILNQTTTRGEQLPALPRTMHFRVTVRDNRSGGGGVNSDDALVRVHAGAGPFLVTEPASTSVTGNLIDVRWDVAQTDQQPIGCTSVDIKLSTDGGGSFSEILVSGSPNDGSELIALPATAVNNLRVMVEAADSIFFAVSPTNFSVQPAKVQVYLARHAEKQAGSDPPLTPQGLARSRKLAELMAQVGVTRVYSTDFRRTQQTAAATAAATSVAVTSYHDVHELAAELTDLPAGERVLVVGHSNTIGPAIAELGVAETVTIAESEFDNLFFVGLTDGGPSFARFKYSTPQSEAPVAPQFAAIRPAAGRGAASIEESARPALRAASKTGELARTAAPVDRFARSDLPVVYLEQNWSPAESVEFYGLRQGSPLMRRAFFNQLEQPDNTDLFCDSDYLASFGFLPRRHSADNPEGYPIGFTGDEAIELNCAACHTSRLTHGGKEYWIDGSQAMTDLDRWQGELVRAIKLTLADVPHVSNRPPNERVALDQGTKFGRFVRRLLGTAAPTATQVHVISTLLRRDYERRQRYNDYNDYGRRFDNDADRAAATKHHPYGYGRLDALGGILNQACATALGEDDNARMANAPVNYPAIWDAPQHTHVQWNGAVDNTATFGPLGRNAGQVIGVFGIVKPGGTLVGYDSSINFDALRRAEQLVTQLWSPPWPDEFGLDMAKAAAGRAVYQANCVTCHALIDRRDPRRDPRDVLVPIDQPFGPWGLLGTDDVVAKNWRDRRAKVGLLAGSSISLPLRGSFPSSPTATVPAREILSHLVFNAIARSFLPWRDELTLDDARQRSMMMAEVAAEETLMRYKSRPLNGVWSTAPYLHNGSVLDMVELLKHPGERLPTFRVGTTEFDPATLGFKNAGPSEFDTSLPGNSNRGHAYGTNLSDSDKAALIEFLKTL